MTTSGDYKKEYVYNIHFEMHRKELFCTFRSQASKDFSILPYAN